MTATPPPTTLSPASSTDLPSYTSTTDADMIPNTTTTITAAAAVSRLRPLYLIVATALHPPLGIGLNGTLPWPSIRADMNFFAKVTRHSRPPLPPPTSSSSSQGSVVVNAVVMGRKTWSSIPPRFRPLAGRVNVVVTRRTPALGFAEGVAEELRGRQPPEGDGVNDVRVQEFGDRGAGVAVVTVVEDSGETSSNAGAAAHPDRIPQPPMKVVVASSLSSAFKALDDSSRSSDSSDYSTGPRLLDGGAHTRDIKLGNIFVIGGAEIYAQSLQLAKEQRRTVRILQTLVKKSDGGAIECDTFFPVKLGEEETQVQGEALAEWLGTGEEGGGKSGAVPLPQGETEWCRDVKSGFEVRVVGWERR